MVFSSCFKCNILSSLFIFLICASLYKKHLFYLKMHTVKENLKVPLTNENDISSCEKENYQKIKASDFGKNNEAKKQCLNFLKKKCNLKQCQNPTGIKVYSFDLKNKNDSISYAKNCANVCKSRCTLVKNCARLKTTKRDPYNITKQSDSRFE